MYVARAKWNGKKLREEIGKARGRKETKEERWEKERERILRRERGEVIKSRRRERDRNRVRPLEIKRNETNGELEPIFRG